MKYKKRNQTKTGKKILYVNLYRKFGFFEGIWAYIPYARGNLKISEGNLKIPEAGPSGFWSPRSGGQNTEGPAEGIFKFPEDIFKFTRA